MDAPKSIEDSERPRTLKEAAEFTGLPYFKIQRAVKAGLLPSYKLFNTRRYVKLRDILELMSASN